MAVGVDLPGGLLLRRLREDVDRTQLWVELEAELGTGYLQRVESGRVVQPSRPTLERILSALDAPYAARRQVMDAFGYATQVPLPSDQDLDWARNVAATELESVPFPAYVLDCRHRLVAWNDYFPRLLEIAQDDPLLGRLAGKSMFSPWFEPQSVLGRMVVDPDSFLPALVRAFRFEMHHFRAEEWHTPLIDELREEFPAFRELWERIEREPPPAGSARPVVPARLRMPSRRIVQFRLSAERFASDDRFRFIYYFPADAETMALCDEWCLAIAERHSSSTATTSPR